MVGGLTTASSLTAARLRFLLKPKGHGGASAAELESFGGINRHMLYRLSRVIPAGYVQQGVVTHGGKTD
jgi:hypothetical protein